jgi:predicted membrane protein
MAKLNHPNNRRGGHVVFGIVIAIIGVFALLHTLSDIPMFDYFLDLGWPVVLIIIGVLLGFRSNFRKNAWWILIAIGVFNLIPVFHIGNVSSYELGGPVFLIAAGLFIAFRKRKPKEIDFTKLEMITSGESTLNIDNTMGGRKEIVTSKEFRGGSIRTTFGGTEVNLMQADGTIQPMVLDIHVSFGSIELIVPSYWEVINEIRPSMGSVEDHRSVRTPDASYERRTLLLRGSCSFGSIEVKSY